MTQPFSEPNVPVRADPGTQPFGFIPGPPITGPVRPVTEPSPARLGRLVTGLALLLLTFGAGYVVGNSQLTSPPSGGGGPSAAPTLVAISSAQPTAPPPGTTSAPPGPSEPALTPEPTGIAPGETLPPNVPADFGVFWQALKLTQDNFVDTGKLTDENLTWGAIRGMIDALGDTGHSVFMTPDQLKAEQDNLQGKLTGIGVIVDQRSGAPIVVSVIDGSPAAGAGILAGDTIVAVDGKSTDRMTADQVVTAIRGPAGTTVTLTLRRAGTTGTIDISIVRQSITIPAVSWTMVPGTHIADVRVVQFSSGLADAAKTAIQAARDAGATKIVMDMRGNPGGFVSEAVDLASQFVGDGGVIYEEKDRSGAIKSIPAKPGGIATELPMVMLVDFGTASSSEIFAGAIQGNNRGKVIGVQTFGTGTVLGTFTLPDGSAIRLGIIEWLTPKGETIFNKGITPDVEVKLPDGGSIVEPGQLKGMTSDQFAASTDTQLQKAVQLLGN
jgi:carboxyl-terminal processing protease